MVSPTFRRLAGNAMTTADIILILYSTVLASNMGIFEHNGSQSVQYNDNDDSHDTDNRASVEFDPETMDARATASRLDIAAGVEAEAGDGEYDVADNEDYDIGTD